jgi:hypothetical protein
MGIVIDDSVRQVAAEGADLNLRVRDMGDDVAPVFLEAFVERVWDLPSSVEPGESALGYASSVLRVPGGAAVVLDCHELTDAQLAQIPDMARSVAEELSISEGVLVADPPAAISAEAPACVLWMRPFPLARPVAAASLGWVVDRLGDDVRCSVVLGLQPVDAPQGDAESILDLVDGLIDQDENVSIWLESDGGRAGVGISRHLTISVALERPASDAGTAEELSLALRAFAQAQASDLRWAAIDPDGTMEAVKWVRISRPPEDRFVDSPLVIRHETECVPDAFWWQQLTPQHIEQLDGEHRRDAEQASDLQLGAASEWVGRAGMLQRAHAREILSTIFMESGTRTGPFDPRANWT